jgi:hypothetical protein
MVWHAVHVHHHDDPAALLGDAVRPLFGRLKAVVPRAYWLRHWRQGPHLRLLFDTDAATFAGAVRPAVAQIIGPWLAAHPSQAHLDPDGLLPLHRRLAEVEREDGPLLPWYPDNSFHPAPAERRAETVPEPEARALLDDFNVSATPAAFAATEAIRCGRADRLGTAFELLVATAHALSPGGIDRAFISFRSHSEAFLSSTSDGRRLRAHWDELYSRQSRTLVARLQEVVAQAGEPSGAVGEWVGLLRPFDERAGALIEAGRVRTEAPARFAGPAGQPELAEISPFHAGIEANPEWWETVRTATWFGRYRLMLNYTYLHLTRLGLRPDQRYLLCHLISSAVEETYATSVHEVINS